MGIRMLCSLCHLYFLIFRVESSNREKKKRESREESHKHDATYRSGESDSRQKAICHHASCLHVPSQWLYHREF